MKTFFHLFLISCLLLTGCSTATPPSTTSSPDPSPIPVSTTTLALIQTSSTVATGAILDFAVTQPATRTRLANEIYSSANFLYTATGGTLPTVAQFQAGLTSYGLSTSDASYAKYTTALTALYATYYAKYVNGSVTASNLSAIINAIAQGAETAAQAYATVTAPPPNILNPTPSASGT